MKFCPECGSKLPLGTAKFCPNCGQKLWVEVKELKESTTSSSETKQTVLSTEPEYNENSHLKEYSHIQDERIDNAVSSIHSLGVKLEETVEQVLKCMGYIHTERRKKMSGSSGIDHEIDIFAVQANNVLAVECKNYGAERKVGTEEIRNFQSKIEDLPKIDHKLFVTNNDFTLDASRYATHKEIELWNGEKLMQLHYQASIGRLPSSSVAKVNSVSSRQNEPTTLELALPVSLGFEQATNLLLVNPLSLEIHNSMLNWYPYIVFDYEVDMKTGIFGRKRYTEEDSHIMDATTGEILDESDIQIDESFCFTPKRYYEPEAFEEAAQDLERNQLIEDLTTFTPKQNYKVPKPSLLRHSYHINVVEPLISIGTAQRMILDEIAEDIGAKYDEIQIKKGSLVYVPKWVIEIRTINGSKSYKREILAASKTVIIDEIALCPKEDLRISLLLLYVSVVVTHIAKITFRKFLAPITVKIADNKQIL